MPRAARREAAVVGGIEPPRRGDCSIDLCGQKRGRGTTAAAACRAACHLGQVGQQRVCAARRRRPVEAVRRAGRAPPDRSRRSAAIGCVSSSSTRKSFSASWRGGAARAYRRRRRPFVRAGDDVEQQRQVGGRARHRPDHREVAVERQRRGTGGGIGRARAQAVRRLVRVDAADMRRHTQRAADVRAERQRAEAGRERRRRTARRAARRAVEVPRIVGDAVDRVVALPVAQHQRHVGLAEDHGAGSA